MTNGVALMALDLIRAQAAEEWAAIVARLGVHAVGDELRIIADHCISQGPLRPPIGSVGTVVAVMLREECSVVIPSAVIRVYLLDFGPGPTHTRPDDRITWAYGDSDLQRADISYEVKRGKRGKSRQPERHTQSLD